MPSYIRLFKPWTTQRQLLIWHACVWLSCCRIWQLTMPGSTRTKVCFNFCTSWLLKCFSEFARWESYHLLNFFFQRDRRTVHCWNNHRRASYYHQWVRRHMSRWHYDRAERWRDHCDCQLGWYSWRHSVSGSSGGKTSLQHYPFGWQQLQLHCKCRG